MATECKIAPFINVDFYVTGAWGEQRATHIHAGVDLSTGKISNVYNMFDGTVIDVDHTGATGSGYGAYIIVQEDSGRTFLYGDLENFSSYNKGDSIKAGALISKEGNPAGTSSTGYHVHVEQENLTKGQAFKFGYNNSVNPCPVMGIQNVATTSVSYIYNGEEPTPPTPVVPPFGEIKKSKFKFVLYARKLRKRY